MEVEVSLTWIIVLITAFINFCDECVSSSEIFSNVFHVFRDLEGCKLPIKSKTVKKLTVFLFFKFGISCPWNMPSPSRWSINLFALDALEKGVRVLLGVKISTWGVYPSWAFLAHYPFFTIISLVKINLFAINAVWVFLKLFLTSHTKSFDTDLCPLLFIDLVITLAKLISAACYVFTLLNYFIVRSINIITLLIVLWGHRSGKSI